MCGTGKTDGGLGVDVATGEFAGQNCNEQSSDIVSTQTEESRDGDKSESTLPGDVVCVYTRR